MKMIKKGVWIADKRGTYVIEVIDERYITLRDVVKDGKGTFHYGRRRVIGVKDLDNYQRV